MYAAHTIFFGCVYDTDLDPTFLENAPSSEVNNMPDDFKRKGTYRKPPRKPREIGYGFRVYCLGSSVGFMVGILDLGL
jgi:hypothetical protein